ncbi:ribonucleoside-diphosphate reductase, adenosylcobalamin-dependent [Alicyclobacillus hesperidum URH17-3-68]|nr:ribonucleoside-diphosphate reductase, adenosylcobalamin-dependent [Alicyclobacillus hesperidum URH17-3-68]
MKPGFSAQHVTQPVYFTTCQENVENEKSNVANAFKTLSTCFEPLRDGKQV